jgi:hypothetical protein
VIQELRRCAFEISQFQHFLKFYCCLWIKNGVMCWTCTMHVRNKELMRNIGYKITRVIIHAIPCEAYMSNFWYARKWQHVTWWISNNGSEEPASSIFRVEQQGPPKCLYSSMKLNHVTLQNAWGEKPHLLIGWWRLDVFLNSVVIWKKRIISYPCQESSSSSIVTWHVG